MKYLMPLRTTEYVDVVARAAELGIRAPVGIALLPGNFMTAASAAELRYHEAAPHLRSAWRSIGLIDGGPYRGPREHAAGAGGALDPKASLVVFFGSGLRTSPARLITLAFGMIVSVLTLRPDCEGSREIRLDAVVERPDGSYACFEYRGDGYELFALAQAVRETWT
ncbi:hypothetical protein FJY68_02315 [candidate division WOR-3 bacterium]|uniref:Uncharacterized protein n=1 Tax=candidate division WOR-3 bacterium TaxID=2052148 RepID=A0A938BNZ9_UNCW3|nr:hypothetical protein [candidate division WOR-3 bacterium]